MVLIAAQIRFFAPWSTRGVPLARHGFVCVCSEYRLATEAPWPAQIEDVNLALMAAGAPHAFDAVPEFGHQITDLMALFLNRKVANPRGVMG